MPREIKKVKIKNGTREDLAKIFGVTIRTVSNSLSGKSNTERSRKIRKAAVEMGGDPIYENSKN